METEADHPGIRRSIRACAAHGSASIRVHPYPLVAPEPLAKADLWLKQFALIRGIRIKPPFPARASASLPKSFQPFQAIPTCSGRGITMRATIHQSNNPPILVWQSCPVALSRRLKKIFCSLMAATTPSSIAARPLLMQGDAHPAPHL